MKPDPHPRAGKNRSYKLGILILVLAMIALAAWAWWIPNHVFEPWITKMSGWMHRFRR